MLRNACVNGKQKQKTKKNSNHVQALTIIPPDKRHIKEVKTMTTSNLQTFFRTLNLFIVFFPLCSCSALVFSVSNVVVVFSFTNWVLIISKYFTDLLFAKWIVWYIYVLLRYIFKLIILFFRPKNYYNPAHWHSLLF